MENVTEMLNAYGVSRKLGVTVSKRVICPGCGKLEHMDGALFALRIEALQVKPTLYNDKADGVKWCRDCQ